MARAYFNKWEDFLDKAQELLQDDPYKTRVTVKYRGKSKITILKVTDNKKVAMYKCKEEDDFKRMDSLLKFASQIFANVEDDKTAQMIPEPAQDAGKKKGKGKKH